MSIVATAVLLTVIGVTVGFALVYHILRKRKENTIDVY